MAHNETFDLNIYTSFNLLFFILCFSFISKQKVSLSLVFLFFVLINTYLPSDIRVPRKASVSTYILPFITNFV